MKIRQALKEKNKKEAVSSNSLRMHLQTNKSFVYWLLLDGYTSKEEKISQLRRILSATDWYVEVKRRRK